LQQGHLNWITGKLSNVDHGTGCLGGHKISFVEGVWEQ